VKICDGGGYFSIRAYEIRIWDYKTDKEKRKKKSHSLPTL